MPYRRIGLRRTLLGCGLAFGLAFLTAASGAPTKVKDWFVAHPEAAYAPNPSLASGDQLVMLFFGKATCAWSSRKQLPAMIDRIKLGLAARAKGGGWASFVAVGVSLDWSAGRGMDYLQRFGVFDEVVAGAGWTNSMAMKYFWGDAAGPAATPQVIVISRRFSSPVDSLDDAAVFGVADERLVARKVGFFEIERWLEHGLPLPTVATVPRASRSSP